MRILMYGALTYMDSRCTNGTKIIVNNCNVHTVSNLVDLTGITPQKGLTTQWLSTVCQIYSGKFHLFVTYYFLPYADIVLANKIM